MLGCQAVVEQEHAEPRQGGQPGGEPPVGTRQMQTPGAAVQIEKRAALGQTALTVPGSRDATRIEFFDRDPRAVSGQAGVHAADPLPCQVYVEIRAPSALRPETEESVRQSSAQAGHVGPKLLLQCVILYRFAGVDNAGREAPPFRSSWFIACGMCEKGGVPSADGASPACPSRNTSATTRSASRNWCAGAR